HHLAALEKAEAYAQMVEAIGAIQTIKAFRAETRSRRELDSRVLETMRSSFESQLFAVYSTTVSFFMSEASTIGLLWFGGHKVLAGDLSAGELMVLHTMLGAVCGPSS